MSSADVKLALQNDSYLRLKLLSYELRATKERFWHDSSHDAVDKAMSPGGSAERDPWLHLQQFLMVQMHQLIKTEVKDI